MLTLVFHSQDECLIFCSSARCILFEVNGNLMVVVCVLMIWGYFFDQENVYHVLDIFCIDKIFILTN